MMQISCMSRQTGMMYLSTGGKKFQNGLLLFPLLLPRYGSADWRMMNSGMVLKCATQGTMIAALLLVTQKPRCGLKGKSGASPALSP